MHRYATIGIVTIIAIGAIVFGIFLTGSEKGDSIDTKTSDFAVFADIPLTDYDGNTVSLSAFEGRPLVINSWAVWCPFCRNELPAFASLQEEFKGDVVVIAIDRQESLKKVKSYTDELGITDDLLFLLDANDAFYKAIGGFSMPETIFVNSAGDIVVHKRGPMELEEMRELTRKIISES